MDSFSKSGAYAYVRIHADMPTHAAKMIGLRLRELAANWCSSSVEQLTTSQNIVPGSEDTRAARVLSAPVLSSRDPSSAMRSACATRSAAASGR